MHSTDDGRTGYPGDVSSPNSYFQLGGPVAEEDYLLLVVEWCAPSWRPHIISPCAFDVQCGTDDVRVQVEGQGTLHCGEMWKCLDGLPYCHYGLFCCFCCFFCKDREYSSS